MTKRNIRLKYRALPVLCLIAAALITLLLPFYGAARADGGETEELILTVRAKNIEITYGSAVPAFEAEYEGFRSGDNPLKLSGKLEFDSAVAEGAKPSAGSYTITPRGVTSSVYTVRFEQGSLNVRKKSLNVYALNQTITYGQPLPPFSIVYNGFLDGEGTEVLQGEPIINCSAPTYPEAGSYYIEVSGLTSVNYDIRFESAVLRVLKKEQAFPNVELKIISLTPNGAVLNVINGAEYTADGGLTWQSSAVFDSLKANTAYDFAYRLKGDKNHEPSDMSEITEAATPRSSPSPLSVTLMIIIPCVIFAAAGVVSLFIFRKKTA